MIFSELYSAYYNTVAGVLKTAVQHPIDRKEMHKIIEQNAFGESVLNIEPAIKEERWQLIRADGTTPIKNAPTMPLTTLEKRWLKAIFLDPRIKLFGDEVPDLSDVEPLFTPDDVSVFDKYSDGDPYEDENYISNFRLILDAIRNQYPLSIKMANRKGGITHMILTPQLLEYSQKDDKFRLIGAGLKYGGTVNLARITECKPYLKPHKKANVKRDKVTLRMVEFDLIDERNALERVLLHFAHFEKQAQRIDKEKYRVRVTYDKDDETEIVIRILSFGPMIKVTAPEHFVELIKDRLIKQKNCGH